MGRSHNTRYRDRNFCQGELQTRKAGQRQRLHLLCATELDGGGGSPMLLEPPKLAMVTEDLVLDLLGFMIACSAFLCWALLL